MTTKELMDEITQGIPWRPKLFVRNPRYPKVTAPGYHFVESAGGFALIHRKSGKYLGHYTKADIIELEKKYARRIPRKREK